MKTKLGIGLATGMFFTATAGTSLPTYPTENVGGNGDGTTTDKFTATAGQTAFTLSESANAIISMTVNGVAVASTDYTFSGASFTYSGTTLAADDKVVIEYYVSAWRLVGDISQDGLTVATDKSVTNLFNWANVLKRVIMTGHNETVQAPVMDTTEETMKAILGSDNVTVTPAAGSHGKTIDCNLSAATLPDPKAFLFVMKDGDDTMALGMSEGQITAVDNVSFAPNAAIVWKPTLTALGDGLHFISEEAAS